jgi:hypothetical protein
MTTTLLKPNFTQKTLDFRVKYKTEVSLLSILEMQIFNGEWLLPL